MADLKDFSSLVDSYYSKVFYHCLKSIKNNYDAADITQDTFIKAFINIKKLKNPDTFGAWLFGICKNEINLFYRNRQRNIFESMDSVDLENIPNESELGETENVSKYSSLYKAIDILDEKYKNLIILKYFAEFSVREIAALTSIDEKLVKSRLYEARKKLENILSKYQNSAEMHEMLNVNFIQERKKEIMSTVKLLELGSHIVGRMSESGKAALLKCAENNEKFTSEVLSELGKIEAGDEFAVECGGKLSYDELIKILACCGWGTLYDFEDTHKIMRDVAAYLGTGGYIESVEAVLYVPSVFETAKWYKKYLGWDGEADVEESSGHCIIEICRNVESKNVSTEGKRFHLRNAGENQPTTKCSFFIIVSHLQLELIRERVVSAGWDKVTDIHDSGFGAKRVIVEDLNGVGLEFLEWRN